MSTRVSSEKEKSFRENFAFIAKFFFSRPFRFVFAFRSLAKNAKIFAFFVKFRFYLFREKIRNFHEIENAKKIIRKFRETFRSLEILAQLSEGGGVGPP